MNEELGEFLGALRVLGEQEVDFVLIGALAMSYHGVVRGTADIDIVPDPGHENLARLHAALESLEAHVPGADPRFDPLSVQALGTGATVKCLTRYGELHIVQGQPGIPPYQELREQADEARLEGLSVAVCSYEHLVAMKRAAGRPQDEIDLADLRAARGEG